MKIKNNILLIKHYLRTKIVVDKLDTFFYIFFSPYSLAFYRVLTQLAGCWKEAVDQSCENSVAKEFVSKVCTAALAPCNETR